MERPLPDLLLIGEEHRSQEKSQLSLPQRSNDWQQQTEEAKGIGSITQDWELPGKDYKSPEGKERGELAAMGFWRRQDRLEQLL